jgi:hypothetical protein
METAPSACTRGRVSGSSAQGMHFQQGGLVQSATTLWQGMKPDQASPRLKNRRPFLVASVVLGLVGSMLALPNDSQLWLIMSLRIYRFLPLPNEIRAIHVLEKIDMAWLYHVLTLALMIKGHP